MSGVRLHNCTMKYFMFALCNCASLTPFTPQYVESVIPDAEACDHMLAL